MTSTITVSAGPRGGIPGAPARDLRVDWGDLRAQKAVLVALRHGDPVPDSVRRDALDGLLAALDALQDAAVDALSVPESEVFGDPGGDGAYPWEAAPPPRSDAP